VAQTSAFIETWQHRAACRGPHAAVFFPPPSFERKFEKLAREERAKMICGSCPVAGPCLDYALSIKEPHGIWGGLSEAERRALLASAEGVEAVSS
jgi:WhiB family redox-sensing transcriptional regulator